MKKTLSVCCTTFNDSAEISDLLKDIEKQTLKPDEVVIADGGSKDDTLGIIENYKISSNLNIKLISGQRLNISEGFNTAIKNSDSEYVAVMATGNAYDERFLEKLMAGFSDESVDMTYALVRGKSDNVFQKKYNDVFLNKNKGSDWPTNHGWMFKKNVFARIGLFYEHFVYAGEDTELNYRFNKAELKKKCVEDAYVYWATPMSYKEQKKQCIAYTKANLQIEGFESCFKAHWKCGAQLIIVLGSIIGALLKLWPIVCILVLGGLALYVEEVIVRGVSGITLNWYRLWVELYAIIKYKNLSTEEYRIDLSKLTYLEE